MRGKVIVFFDCCKIFFKLFLLNPGKIRIKRNFQKLFFDDIFLQ